MRARQAVAVPWGTKNEHELFCTDFLNTPRGPGHPGKIPGISQVPSLETQGKQTFEGGRELFGPHPFAWKTPIPPSSLRAQKVNLCALFRLWVPVTFVMVETMLKNRV